MLGPILCCRERKSDLKPRQGRNQGEKQEQQALVCLFVSLPMLIRICPSRCIGIAGTSLESGQRNLPCNSSSSSNRTSDSQPQQPHMSLLRKGKKGSNRVGTRKWTEMCAQAVPHADNAASFFAPLSRPTDCTAPLRFFRIYNQLKLCRSFTNMYSFSSES